jgi:hypothetical protein
MRVACLNATVLLLLAISVGAMDGVGIDHSGTRFTFKPSGGAFIPWGLNYGHGGRLIEDFWEDQWDLIERDFADMKQMGANVVRVHLQFGKFMEAANRPRRHALDQLGRLLELGERTGLYLDLTGLACYRKSDVPDWYDALGEGERWKAQSAFWEAVATKCAASPAVFCYDLMNEPIVPGERRQAGDWYSGKLFGGYDFVQFITLDPQARKREQIARQWIETLAAGIRKHDRDHLITVGLLPWGPKRDHLSGFVPETVAPAMDFVSVHIYPESGKVDQAIDVLRRFAVGKPLVIEETFPLACKPAEWEEFFGRSRGIACGWMGHYDGIPPAELEKLRVAGKITIAQAMMLAWLELFEKHANTKAPGSGEPPGAREGEG